jgi:flagellum-specific peptidoglycan hydrolase FlgJ
MKKIFLFAIVITSFICARAQTPEDIQNYINAYKDIAMSEMQRTGVPASISLAQGILESAAGTSDLTKQSNNHFGIKCKLDWTGNVIYHDDDEKNECFRVYSCAADSYKDHSDFLKNRPNYAFLFQLDPTDYEGWAKGLKKAGYATEKDYPERLIELIVNNHLQDYTLAAMQKTIHITQPIITADTTNNDNTETADAQQDNDDAININYSSSTQQKNNKAEEISPYPAGVFHINRTKVVYAKAGVSLFALASNYNVEYGKLLQFNELKREDILTRSCLIFLERKQKKGANNFHVVAANETIEHIAQTEGVRLENLLTYNHLSKGNEPTTGAKIYLRNISPHAPKLAHTDYTSAANHRK